MLQRKLLTIFFLMPLVSFSQWTPQTTGTTQMLRSVNFIDAQTGFACGEFGTMIKTTNGGTNWSALNPGTAFNLRSVHFLNANTGLSCGHSASNSIIIRTTNGGANWASVYTGTSPLLSVTFASPSSAVCVGNSGTTLYTTNGGVNWLVGQPSGFLVTFYTSFMLNASTGFCGGVNTIFSPLFAKTTDGGANWNYSSFMVNNNEATLLGMHFLDAQTGFAISSLWNGQGGISRTINGAANWTHTIFLNAFYDIKFPAALTGYICGAMGDIFKSTDGGGNWIELTSPTSVFLRSLDFVDSLTGYIAGDNGTILKTTTGGILAVKPVSNIVPKEYRLYQNYPNPFNPTTKIRFSIPSVGQRHAFDLQIIIYDILGREAAVLVNEALAPGTYEVEFDAGTLPSGVYYYTLSTDGFTQSKKMVLVK